MNVNKHNCKIEKSEPFLDNGCSDEHISNESGESEKSVFDSTSKIKKK